MVKQSVKGIVLRTFVLVGVAFGVTFLYALVHEGGHALFVLLFGGEVTSFKVNFFTHAPSVSYVGINNPMQKALINLGGPLLPLLFIPLLTLFLRRTKNVAAQGILLLMLNSLLVTIIISIVIAFAFGFGKVMPNEDMAKFILYSGIHPFVVAGVLLLLFGLILIYLLKVGRVKTVYLEVLKSLRESQVFSASTLIVKLITGLCLLAIGVVIINPARSTTQVSSYLSYQTKVQVDLGDIKLGSERVYEFGVDEQTTFDLVYSLQTDSEVTFRLVNESGGLFPFNNQDSIIIYQGSENIGPGYFTGFTLSEGDYVLEVITSNGLGSLTMYIDTRAPNVFEQESRELLAQINSGEFTADSYHEEGYQLVYQGELMPGTDQLLLTIPSANYGREVSAFVVGDYDQMSLCYVADGQSHTLLKGFKATMGYGLPAQRGLGEFRSTAINPAAKLYIYIKS